MSAILTKEQKKELGLCNGKMVKSTKECGRQEFFMVKEPYQRQNTHIQEALNRESLMGKELTSGKMAENMSDNMSMEKRKGLEFIHTQNIKSTKVNGKTENNTVEGQSFMIT